MRTRLLSSALAAALLPLPAAAQVLSTPERAAEVVSRTTDQARSTQALNFSINLLGGYDKNDTDMFQPVDPEAIPVFVDSTSSGTVDATLEYTRAKATQLVTASVSGASSFYGSNVNIGPTKSFAGNLTLSTPMGQASRFSAAERLTYDSIYSFGAFQPIAGEVAPGEMPGAPTSGVADLASITSDTTIGLQHRLGRRNSLNGNYGFVRQIYTGEGTGDSNSHRATVGFSRQVQRNTGLQVSYAYSNGEYAPLVGGGGTRPLVGHFIQGGFDYTKRLSPRRAVQFAAGGGATQTDAISGSAATAYSFWAPSGYLRARIDLARTWALSADYNLGTTALSGLTQEAYSASAFNTSVGGSAGPLSLVFSAGGARGATGAGAAVSSDYFTWIGAAQAGMPIGDHFNLVVQYNWYRYELSGNAEVPSSIPSQFSRSSIRAGVSIRLPIIETR